jgi:uncharacterized membrane protein
MISKELVIDVIVFSVLFMAIDSIYLYSSSKHFGRLIRLIQGSPLKLRIIPTLAVYYFLILGWFLFVYKDLGKETLNSNLLKAISLGVVIYGVYEFTNYAIINSWDLTTVIMDTTWGGILFGITTYLFIKYKTLGKQ